MRHENSSCFLIQVVVRLLYTIFYSASYVSRHTYNILLLLSLQWDLTCEENLWKLTMVGTVNNIGQFVGLAGVGIVSDRWVARVQTTDSDGLKHVPVNLILQNADPDTSTFLAVKLHVSHCTLRICPDIWLLIMPKNVKIKDFWFSCHIFFLSYHGPYFLALCCI